MRLVKIRTCPTLPAFEPRKLFPVKEIGKVRETSLSANQERSETEKKRLVRQGEGEKGEERKALRGRPVDPTKLVVKIAPMEIRTFIVHFEDRLEIYDDGEVSQQQMQGVRLLVTGCYISNCGASMACCVCRKIKAEDAVSVFKLIIESILALLCVLLLRKIE